MDKFNTPVLNEKKFDANPEHIGAKHSAGGTLLTDLLFVSII
jgi:hypothetical protein